MTARHPQTQIRHKAKWDAQKQSVANQWGLFRKRVDEEPASTSGRNAPDQQKAAPASKGVMDLGAMMKKMLKR